MEEDKEKVLFINNDIDSPEAHFSRQSGGAEEAMLSSPQSPSGVYANGAAAWNMTGTFASARFADTETLFNRSTPELGLDPNYHYNSSELGEEEEDATTASTRRRGLDEQQHREMGSSRNSRQRRFLRIVLAISGWYAFSSLLMVFNKFVLGKSFLNFSFPLFMTACNMMTHTLLSELALLVWFNADRNTASTSDHNNLTNSNDNGSNSHSNNATNTSNAVAEWKRFFLAIVPCALASGLDIGLSNASLKFISLSFYTMVKSSSPIFVLLFAFLFRLEKPQAKLVGIIAIIAFGTILTVANEPQFEAMGFYLIFAATVLSGLRWSLTQILLSGNHAGNPLQIMRRISPITAVLILFISLLAEGGFRAIFFESIFFDSFASIMKTLGLVAISGIVSFFMILCEYHLIHLTSVVTLSVAGIFKELLLIFISSILYKDPLTVLNIIGFCITIIGIILYNYWKLTVSSSSSSSQPQSQRISSGLPGRRIFGIPIGFGQSSNSRRGFQEIMLDDDLNIVADNNNNEDEENFAEPHAPHGAESIPLKKLTASSSSSSPAVGGGKGKGKKRSPSPQKDHTH